MELMQLFFQAIRTGKSFLVRVVALLLLLSESFVFRVSFLAIFLKIDRLCIPFLFSPFLSVLFLRLIHNIYEMGGLTDIGRVGLSIIERATKIEPPSINNTKHRPKQHKNTLYFIHTYYCCLINQHLVLKQYRN